MTNKKILMLISFLLFLFLLVGCFPKPTPSNEAPIITSDPITTAIVGEAYTYDVNATDPDDDILTYSLLTKPTGMTINATTGVISWKPTFAQVGDNTVTVGVSDGDLSVTQSFTIKVSKPTPTPVPPVKLTKIIVLPATMTLFIGESEAIESVTAHYSNGSTKDIPLGSCTYASSATEIATVDAGVITAVAEGTATITVSYGGKTDTLVVTINPVLLTSIVVLPETMTLLVGKTENIVSVTAHYSNGSTFVIDQPGYDYGCGTSDSSIATVSAAHLVEAVSVGEATITVSYTEGGVTKTDTIEVTVNPIRLTSIVVLPETMLFLEADHSKTITSVTAHYNDGSTAIIALGDCTYLSSDTLVAVVLAGNVSKCGLGTATITVMYEDKTDTVEVTVGPVHNVTQDFYRDTIQDAIGDALTSAGDTIEVAAGTYDEVVIVNKSVILLGANDGVCAGVNPGTRGPESIIDNTVFVIQANDVTIDGFKFDGGGTHLGGYAGINMIMSTSGHTIVNNILVGLGKNYLPAYRGILVGTFYVVNNFDTTITCNDIHGWKTGIFVNPTGEDAGLLIQDNSIYENWAGIGCDGSGVTILGNDFTDNVEGFGCAGDDVVAHNNNFDGNVDGVLSYKKAVINATDNWWGDASGPYHPVSNPLGTGDRVNDNVGYIPWSTNPN